MSTNKVPNEHEWLNTTVNYANNLLDGAALAGVDPDDLASRKPHTKTGTGSSGTDHQGADGKAAIRARETVEDALRDKQGGAFTSIADSVKQAKKEGLAESKRDEKQATKMQRQVEVAQKDKVDYLDWLAHLATDSWRQRMDKLGNDVRSAPLKKRVSGLEKKAEENDWPTKWDDSFGSQLHQA